MPTTNRPGQRRWAALAATGLVAALAPVVALGAPSAADPGCPSEVAPRDPLLGIPTAAHCDDTMAPETTLEGATPSLNPPSDGSEGPLWLTSTTVSFAFRGAQPAADAADDDLITFQCRLHQGTPPAAESGWSTCASGKSFKVDPTSTSPYTFEVRAVDSVDAGVDITAGMVPGTGPLPIPVLNPFPAAQDVPDHDTTPEQVTFLVDPNRPGRSRINGAPVDVLNRLWPMVRADHLELELVPPTDEPAATFRCTLDEDAVPCQPGPLTLSDLEPGDHIFTAAAHDLAGNREHEPSRINFSVPKDLRAGRKSRWRTKRGEGYFGGDFLQTRREGAQVRTRVRYVKEIRLLAPIGPRQGKVEVLVGRRLLRTISLRGKTYQPMQVFSVRSKGSVRMSGKLRVRVVNVPRRKGYVRIDALLAH